MNVQPDVMSRIGAEIPALPSPFVEGEKEGEEEEAKAVDPEVNPE